MNTTGLRQTSCSERASLMADDRLAETQAIPRCPVVPALKEGEYHIVRDARPTSYPYDVMRRIRGQDHRIKSFGTEIHARYFAAAQNIANNPSEGPSKTKLPASPDAGGGPILEPEDECPDCGRPECDTNH